MSLAAPSPEDDHGAGDTAPRQKGDRILLSVTVLLVLAGLVLLVLGFEQDSLGLVYLSIGCTAVAGVTLIVFSRLRRRYDVQLAMEANSPHWPEAAAAVEEPSTTVAPRGSDTDAQRPPPEAGKPNPDGDPVPLDGD